MVDATTQEQVQEKAKVAQEKLSEGAATMRSRVREQMDERSTQAGEQVASSAQALRSTSEHLREDGQDSQARAAERAADQAERLGGYLKEADGERILGDLEAFGRRQPLAVAAIGVAAGFMASRFLKASSSTRYATQQSYGSQSPVGRDRDRAVLGEGYGGGAASGEAIPGVPPMTAGSPAGR